ncbi:uncharacterized protein [Miscanthus floridulus]|uniref:uncharacterized protein isoform X2 n=1 Tax=Miscanthus floridulus TaxID=154761 RepID=UPI0034586558
MQYENSWFAVSRFLMQKTIFWCTYFEFFSCNDHAVKLQDHGMGCELELYAEGHGTCNGVIIKKIEQSKSSESASDLNEGDIIDRVNGVHFSNAAVGARLLDIGANHDDCNGMRICLEFGVRGCEIERAVVVQKSTCSGLNRWPFPKPIIVQHYFGGKFIRDEWFTLDI